ncbi:MAG: acetyl-CoA carboxylase biotin carboxyl carrier protein [Planctomycetes bacterium]|nr:acetyl-CoA carboxylase biotin carboxyl carrier protein [Planctomycetota bacterium]MCC7172882.1 acetyl-CoA carboxylase biotin carboxyl carrier protein [Planctomycetota bacterium]
MDMGAIEHLIRLMTDNGLMEVEVRSGEDRKIRLSRRANDSQPMMFSSPTPQAFAAAPPAAAGSAPAAGAPAAKSRPSDVFEFVSPMVGTFYRAPSPEAPPYCSTGDKVQPGSVLCIIEAMKVMNEIKAELGGEVVDILVENGEAVEFGQPLLHIKKTG